MIVTLLERAARNTKGVAVTHKHSRFCTRGAKSFWLVQLCLWSGRLMSLEIKKILQC